MSMVMRVGILFVVLVLLAPGSTAAQQGVLRPAVATEPQGGKFVELCRSPNLAGRETCGGVVVSLIDANIMIGQKYPDQRPFCPSRRLNNEQARQMFVNWAASQDDVEAMDFPAIVITALRERYPCTVLPRK